MRALFLATITLLLSPCTKLRAEWLQFRGSQSTGTTEGATIPDSLRIEWSASLPGRGLASPIVVGTKVFVACASGPRQERLHLLCRKVEDGSAVWERQLRATGRTMAHPKTSVAACTPCSDGKAIYTLWSSNDLAAFDFDGNLLWLRGLTVDYPNASNSLGMASSPILVGGTLVVVIENDSESYTLGIDPKTGKNLWKLERPRAANWTSPLVLEPGGTDSPQALLQSAKGLTAVNGDTGSILWEYTEGASTMSSGTVAGGKIFLPSNGITALQPLATGAAPTQLWRSKQTNPATISPLVLSDRLFSINGAGVLSVLGLPDGRAAWKLRLVGPFSSSPIGAGTRLVAVNEKGLIQVVDTAGQEGKVIAELQLPLRVEPSEDLLSTPAASGDHLFIRSDSTLWRVGKQ